MPPADRPHRADGGLGIGVVGGGLAGLAVAWRLGQRQAVTLYERQPRPGFTAASLAAPGSTERIDVPLRVFYPGYYPSLVRLYQALGIRSEPVSYAASFSDAQGQLYFRYRNLRLGALAVGTLAPQDLLLGPPAWRILGGLLRFRREALPALARGALAGLSLGDLVQGYPREFVEGFLLPAVCTVCTCSPDAARAFPAEVIVDYLARGVARQSVRRVVQGADAVEQALRGGIARVRCDADVTQILPGPDSVGLRLADGSEVRHAQVVVATQANQARRLLAGQGLAEAEVLAGFRYQPVEVLTHTDAALMPARRRDWSPVNLRLAAGPAEAAEQTPESTIWVNAVQPGLRGAPEVFQTVHPQRRPAADRLLGQARFERPVVDAGTAAALARLERLHAEPGRRLWFCGAYAQAGIPLLESAVRSAEAVVERIDQGLRAQNSA
jgi:predicted NAD/FAD-binding protein